MFLLLMLVCTVEKKKANQQNVLRCVVCHPYLLPSTSAVRSARPILSSSQYVSEMMRIVMCKLT